MNGNYPELRNLIIAGRRDGTFTPKHMYVVGNIVVASGSFDVLKDLSAFIIVFSLQQLEEYADGLRDGPEKEHVQEVAAWVRNDTMSGSNPHPSAVNFGASVLAKKLGGLLLSEGDSYAEELYSDLFNKVVEFTRGGSMFEFVEKLDMRDGQAFINQLWGAMKIRVYNMTSDIIRWRNTHKEFNPVDDEGSSLVDNMSGDDLLPSARDTKEDFMSSLQDVWEDVERVIVRRISPLIDYLIEKTRDFTPKSPWAGWDEDAGDYTRKANMSARRDWQKLLSELFRFIKGSMLRQDKPLSHAKLRGVILQRVKHKALATHVKDHLMLIIAEVARKIARGTLDGSKLRRTMEFFDRKERGYETDIEELRHQMTASRKLAARILRFVDVDSYAQLQGTRVGDMVRLVVPRVFVACYQ